MRFLWWGKRKDKTPKPTQDERPSTGTVVETRSPIPKVETRSPLPKLEPWGNGAIRDHLLALSPTEFEHAVARLLSEIGYTSVQHIGGAGDRKVDILCKDVHGGLVAVQCKRYAPGKKVTAPNMDDFYGMMVKRRARQGI